MRPRIVPRTRVGKINYMVVSINGSLKMPPQLRLRDRIPSSVNAPAAKPSGCGNRLNSSVRVVVQLGREVTRHWHNDLILRRAVQGSDVDRMCQATLLIALHSPRLSCLGMNSRVCQCLDN